MASFISLKEVLLSLCCFISLHHCNTNMCVCRLCSCAVGSTLAQQDCQQQRHGRHCSTTVSAGVIAVYVAPLCVRCICVWCNVVQPSLLYAWVTASDLQ